MENPTDDPLHRWCILEGLGYLQQLGMGFLGSCSLFCCIDVRHLLEIIAQGLVDELVVQTLL